MLFPNKYYKVKHVRGSHMFFHILVLLQTKFQMNRILASKSDDTLECPLYLLTFQMHKCHRQISIQTGIDLFSYAHSECSV